MVIKDVREMKCHKYVSHVQKNCQRTWTKLKFINYFQGFHTIDILEDISKYDLNNSREKTHRGVPLRWTGCCKSTNLLKRTPPLFFCLEFYFFGTDRKSNCDSSAINSIIVQDTLSKEVKKVLQRRDWGTGVEMGFQKKTKGAIRKTLLYVFYYILCGFCLNSVSMDRH